MPRVPSVKLRSTNMSQNIPKPSRIQIARIKTYSTTQYILKQQKNHEKPLLPPRTNTGEDGDMTDSGYPSQVREWTLADKSFAEVDNDNQYIAPFTGCWYYNNIFEYIWHVFFSASKLAKHTTMIHQAVSSFFQKANSSPFRNRNEPLKDACVTFRGEKSDVASYSNRYFDRGVFHENRCRAITFYTSQLLGPVLYGFTVTIYVYLSILYLAVVWIVVFAVLCFVGDGQPDVGAPPPWLLNHLLLVTWR